MVVLYTYPSFLKLVHMFPMVLEGKENACLQALQLFLNINVIGARAKAH
jgi:hypothetical protein